MAAPERTLGDLRDELRSRLGFGAQGSQSGPNNALLDSILRTCQVTLYWKFDWNELNTVSPDTFITGKSQRFYAYPDNFDPKRLISFQTEDLQTITNPSVWPMLRGIEWFHDGSTLSPGSPQRYELRDKLEIWPIPDRSGYVLRLEYIKRIGNFTKEADFVTVNSDIVLLFAVAIGKAHYQMKDAGVVLDQLRTTLIDIHAGVHSGNKYIRDNRIKDISEFTDPLNVLDVIDAGFGVGGFGGSGFGG